MFEGKKQLVPYPKILDEFGLQLKQLIESLGRESLKSAIMADICKTIGLVQAVQQLIVMMYNLNVTNYSAQMEKVVELEKKLGDLATRCAGYSERIGALEVEIKKLKEKGGS